MIDLGFESYLRRITLEEGMALPKERQTVCSCSAVDEPLASLLAVLERQDVVRVADNVPWRPTLHRELVTHHVCYADECAKQAALADLVRATAGLKLVITKSRPSCEMVGF